MQITLLESLDKKYNLNLYMNEYKDKSLEFFSNLSGGCSSDIPILTGETKLYYPKIGMYLKTKLSPESEKNVKFLHFIKANIVPTNFPYYVIAKT